jgi:ABC-type sugar transport system ATPase subunit
MIRLNKVCKYYKAGFPIHDFSYTFEDNKKYVIAGPSGSGKTTLLRLIAGLESLSAGEIYREETLIGKVDYQLHPSQRKIGMVFQDPTLWPHMTVRENILFGLKGSAIDEMVLTLKIKDILDKYPDEISGGESKRVALARMMVLNWRYLLLDEPLTNIDSALKSEIISFIHRYTEKNKTTLIYVTHNAEEALKIEGKRILF